MIRRFLLIIFVLFYFVGQTGSVYALAPPSWGQNKDSWRILGCFVSSMRETNNEAVALDDVMEKMYELGYDHFAVSKVWNVLEESFPEGKPADSLDHAWLQVAERIQEDLDELKVFQAVLELCSMKEHAAIAEVAGQVAGGLAGQIRKVVAVLDEKKWLSQEGDVVSISDEQILFCLASRIDDCGPDSGFVTSREKLCQDLMNRCQNGVLKSVTTGEKILSARELYQQATQFPFGLSLFCGYSHFGRNLEGLKYAVESTLQREAETGNDVNILVVGGATGEQVDDAIAYALAWIDANDFKGRVNVVGTDLEPVLVHRAMKRQYLLRNVAGTRMDPRFGTKAQLRESMAYIEKSRDGVSARMLSPQELLEKGVNIQWQTLDVLSDMAVAQLRQEMQFDLVAGANVHYNATEETSIYCHFFANMTSLLKVRGRLQFEYMRHVRRVLQRAQMNACSELVDYAVVPKEMFGSVAEEELTLFNEDYGLSAITGYALKKMLVAEYEENGFSGIRGFLEETKIVYRFDWDEILLPEFRTALIYLLLDDDLYGSGMMNELLDFLYSKSDRTYLSLLNLLRMGLRGLREDDAEKLQERILVYLDKYRLISERELMRPVVEVLVAIGLSCPTKGVGLAVDFLKGYNEMALRNAESFSEESYGICERTMDEFMLFIKMHPVAEQSRLLFYLERVHRELRSYRDSSFYYMLGRRIGFDLLELRRRFVTSGV